MLLSDIVIQLEIDTLANWIAILGLLFNLFDILESSVQKL